MPPSTQQNAPNAEGGPHSSPVGLVGVGLVGSALAERFLASGLTVLGFDLQADRLEVLRRLGGEPVSSPRVLAGRCRRVVLSLPGSDQVRMALDAMSDHLRPGQVVVDTSTGDPDAAAEAGRLLEARGVAYLDATISGSSEQVRAAEAVVIAGGSPAGFASCLDLFDAFARKAHLVGPCGSGSRLKLVSNLILGLNRAALAEGLALADAWGLDLRQALDVLRDSAAASRAMEAKGEKMITGNFEPQARLSQHHKDVRLMLDAAARLGMTLPLSRVHDRLLALLEGEGLGDLDNAAIIRAFGRPLATGQAPGPGPDRGGADPERPDQAAR